MKKDISFTAQQLDAIAALIEYAERHARNVIAIDDSSAREDWQYNILSQALFGRARDELSEVCLAHAIVDAANGIVDVMNPA